MGGVMLDPMHFEPLGGDFQRASYLVGDPREPVLHLDPIPRHRRHPESIGSLAQKSRPRIAGNGQDANVRSRCAARGDRPTQRLGGETGCMLDAIEPLLLGSGHQSAVDHRGRTRVTVVGIDSENCGQFLGLTMSTKR